MITKEKSHVKSIDNNSGRDFVDCVRLGNHVCSALTTYIQRCHFKSVFHFERL